MTSIKVTVWVVSYCDDGDKEPTVTVFDNWNAAINFKQFLLDEKHQRVSCDESTVYRSFSVEVK